MDSTSETRLQFVFPKLADKIRCMAEMLEGEGITIIVAQGLRTWPVQDALFAKGRDSQGNVIDKSQVVTNARGGESWHNFGLAVDCAIFDREHQTIDWNASHPAWKRMEAVGISLGLTSGANWTRLVDAPHFQITGAFPEAAPNSEVRRLFLSGGIDAIWRAVSITEGEVAPNVAEHGSTGQAGN